MFEDMDLAKRIELATRKTKRVLEHVSYLMQLHENNAIIVYSKKLSSQMLKSPYAFDVSRMAMY